MKNIAISILLVLATPISAHAQTKIFRTLSEQFSDGMTVSFRTSGSLTRIML